MVRRRKMKKAVAMALAAILTISMTACAGSGKEDGSGEAEGGTLEVAVTYTGDTAAVFKEIIADFEEESGYTVNVAEYGGDYESTLKTRMAANELSDVFMTHGWSLLRYKEYLMDLSNEEWVKDYDESALGTIQDEDGSVYVMMIGEGINGIVVNKDACDAAGVDPYSIHTWDDFTAACQQIKDTGVTPISVLSNAGLLANIAGTFVSYEGELAEDSEAMLDGTWDWESYNSLLDYYAEWIEKGFFYEDIMTMNDADLTERFASGEGAFNLGNGPEIMLACRKLNPDANFIFMPIFASQEGGKEFVGIGEGSAFGIWKDTENEEAAKALLEYLRQPEIALKINEQTGEVSCQKPIMEQDQGYGMSVFDEMKEKCTECNLLYGNLWDRQYMPSGMWAIFGTASNMLFDDSSSAGRQAVLDYLKENYQSLYEAAQQE